jgi:SulP family sulfate permease
VRRSFREQLMQDLAGGATAASLSLPVGIALGAVTLDVLGPDYASQGVAAGVYGVILCSLLTVLFGSRSPAVYVPRSITAVFVAAMLLEAGATYRAVTGDAPPPLLLYSTLFLFLALSGAFQALIGLFRLSALVKYMPHPVLAGFMNAVAILLMLAQIPWLLGAPAGTLPAEIVIAPHLVRWGSILVAAVTLASLFVPALLPFRVPRYLFALLAGTLAHHVLAALMPELPLGGVLGEVSRAPPEAGIASVPELIDEVAFASMLPGIAVAALGLALIGSLDTLLNMKAFERITHQPSDAQHELARLGVANTLAPLLGALPCGISLAASAANYSAGSRSTASLLAHGAAALAAVLALGPLLGLMPRAAVSAILVAIAFGVLDRPTIATVRRLVSGKVRKRARLAMDVLVMLLVASLAMLASMPIAVGAGLLITVLSFLVNMSHSVVRREIHGDAMRSRRSRSAAEMGVLARCGVQIVVIELEGVVFFGTADDLLSRVENCLAGGASHIIIDIRRVHDVDSTGAQMLIQIHERVAVRGRRLIVSEAAPGRPQWDFFVDTGVVKSLGERAFAADTDRALEIAENELLAAESSESGTGAEIPLRALQPFERLDADEIAVVAPRLSRRSFRAGEFVFREGEPGHELFIIAQGSASVRRLDGARSLRLVTFSAGLVFGEMALLDATPRSASVQADGELLCWVMSRDVFDELVEQHHAIALKLLASLSRELGRRLRFANETIDRM